MPFIQGTGSNKMSGQAVATEERTDAINGKTTVDEDVVQGIADKLGVAARSIKVYGEPIERDGAVVIPISKVSYGFGGGKGKQKEQEGSGGGGGLQTSPVGYIEMKGGETRFHAIFDLSMLAPLLATGSFALLTLFWGVRKLIPGSRTK